MGCWVCYESRANETLGGLDVEGQESDEEDESDEEVLFDAVLEKCWGGFCNNGLIVRCGLLLLFGVCRTWE